MNIHEIIQELLVKKPYLAPYFAGQHPDTFTLENAKNGQKIICKQKNNGIIRLSSQYNPDQEALRTIPGDAENWHSSHIIILMGLGNPHIFKQIESYLKPNQICIAIDAQFDLGIFLCGNFMETLEFLRRPGSHMFCGNEMEEGLSTYLESIPREKLKGIKIIKHHPSLKLNPEFYSYVEEMIHVSFKSKISDLLTRFEFEKLWIRNIVANSLYFPENPDKNRPHPVNLLYYQGILGGIPALLVSAGPSLRKSLDTIRKLRKKCFILVCDTSMKVLSSAGIPFHGAITLDAQKHSIFHFHGLDLSGNILFADIVSNPELLENTNPGSLIFSTTARFAHSFDGRIFREATPGTEYIENFHGTLGSLQSGGSVATSAYDLLRFLGAGNIFLIGQDLAYTGREIHSTGTHHNEKWLTLVKRSETLESINEKIIRKRETFDVPSLSGGSVLTDFVLNLYRNWFEQSIPESGVKTWNLSSDGAFIENAFIPENVNEFIDALPEIPDPMELFRDAQKPEKHIRPGNQILMDDLNRALNGKIENITQIKEKYPFTENLIRKIEVYIKRNQQKLGEERSKELYEKNLLKTLKELERGLRPYLS